MTLKIEINKVKLHHTKRKQIDKLNAQLMKLKLDRAKLMLKPAKNISAWADALKDMGNEIGRVKRELAEFNEVHSTAKKKIHIFSDKVHVFYPESTNDADGRTKYDKENPIEVKIDSVFTQSSLGATNLKELKNTALDELRQKRKQRREVGFIEKTYALKDYPQIKTTYKVYLGGGYGSNGTNTYKDIWRGTNKTDELTFNSNLNFIHHEGGTFLKLKEIAKLKECFAAKKPLDNDKHIGVEIEFISKSDKVQIAKLLSERDLQKHVCLVDDGSVYPEKENGYKYSHELTVLVKEQDYKRVITAITECLAKADSKVTKRCGLHVHFDMRNRNREVVYSNLVKVQDVLFDMNPRNRKDGDGDTCFSRPCDTSDFNEAMGRGSGGRRDDRYVGINIQAYAKHKTFEIRIHSGTINATKINNWITLLLAVVNKDKTYASTVSTPELFVERFGLDNEMLEYMKARVAKFNVKGKHVTVDEAS